jgi:hypothetical protein
VERTGADGIGANADEAGDGGLLNFSSLAGQESHKPVEQRRQNPPASGFRKKNL